MFAVVMIILSQSSVSVPVKPRVSAQVLRARPVNEAEWKRSKEQVERILVEKDGRKILVRLIEHQ